MSEQTHGTALVLPESDAMFTTLRAQAVQVRERAMALHVRTHGDAEVATAVLADMAGLKARAEERRLALTRPHEQYQRAVNAFVKDFLSPVLEGDAYLRPLVLAFQREEKRKADEEDARQRREAETVERLARAAAERTEREAAAARAAAEKAVDDADYLATFQARERARAAEEARVQAVAAAQAKAWEAARAPVTPRPLAPVRTASGATATAKEHWTFALEEFDQVPLMYLLLNEGAVRRAIAAGVREIPGLRIFDEGQLAVGGRR